MIASAHLCPKFLVLQVLEQGVLPQHAPQGGQREVWRPKVQPAETDLHQPLHLLLLRLLQQACRPRPISSRHVLRVEEENPRQPLHLLPLYRFYLMGLRQSEIFGPLPAVVPSS